MRVLAISALTMAVLSICGPTRLESSSLVVVAAEAAAAEAAAAGTASFTSFYADAASMLATPIDNTFALRIGIEDPSIGTNWGCTEETGPDPVDSPIAIGLWSQSATDGRVIVPPHTCFVWSYKTVNSTVCAPGDGPANVSVADVQGRMWTPCQNFCAVNDMGCQWRDANDTVLMELTNSSPN